MSGLIDTWAGAFAATQLAEIPVYLHAGSRLPAAQRWLFAAGASTITHPVVWFAFPWDSGHYGMVITAAEGFAVAAEALWAGCFRLRHPLEWSLAANAVSVLFGTLLRWPG